MIQPSTPEAVKVAVKRDGPRGWHWIAAEHFDPAKHQLYAPEVEQPAKVAKPRKPKSKG